MTALSFTRTSELIFQKLKTSFMHKQNERVSEMHLTPNERTSGLAELVQGTYEEVSIYRYFEQESIYIHISMPNMLSV